MTHVRPLTTDDFDAWLPLWNGYVEFYETKLAPEITRHTFERLTDNSTNMHAALALNEDDERARSVAAFRRRTERQKKQAQGFQMPQEKISREVVIPEVITIQELANRMAIKANEVIKTMMKMTWDIEIARRVSRHDVRERKN